MVDITAIPTGSNPELSFQIRGGTASKEVHADNTPKPSPAGIAPVSRGNAAQRLEPGLPQGRTERTSRPGETRGRARIIVVGLLALAAIWATGCDTDKMTACAAACGSRGMARFSLVTVPGNNEPQSACVCADQLTDGGRQ